MHTRKISHTLHRYVRAVTPNGQNIMGAPDKRNCNLFHLPANSGPHKQHALGSSYTLGLATYKRVSMNGIDRSDMRTYTLRHFAATALIRVF
jgi:hypothetical protein